MWETAFNIEMLHDSDVIVSCPSEELVEELMSILADNGVTWCSLNHEVPDINNSRWADYKEDTCYWIESGQMSYADRQYAEDDPDSEYSGHIKCTFFGPDGAGDLDIDEESSWHYFKPEVSR